MGLCLKTRKRFGVVVINPCRFNLTGAFDSIGGVREIALSKMASKEEVNHSKSIKYSSPAHKAGVSYIGFLTIRCGDQAKMRLRSPHLTRSSLVDLKVLSP